MTREIKDLYWSRTARFIEKYAQSGDALVAPDEFKSIFNDLVIPYHLVRDDQWANYQWVVIHKGRLLDLNYSFIENIYKDFFLVFSNEVFIVFSAKDIRVRVDLKSHHVVSFTKALDELRDSEEKKLTIDSSQIELDKILCEHPSNISDGLAPKFIKSDAISRQEIEIDARTYSQVVYLGNEILLCRILAKYLIYCDAEDKEITPHLAMNGCWESWITIAMTQVIEEGWYCLDIGANHGYYTLVMADAVGTEGRVLAIEPNPQLADLLVKTLSVNGFKSRSEVVQKAISKNAGQDVRLVLPGGRGLNGTICGGEPSELDRVFQVETVTIDELTQDWLRVDFIKIDAEGAEQDIWQGLTTTIQRNQNITIVLEFNCARCSNPKEFLQDIVAIGFKLKYIDYDAAIKPLTIDRCLTEHPEEDWMLYLHQ
jgi:FkbM family methyltransferase